MHEHNIPEDIASRRIAPRLESLRLIVQEASCAADLGATVQLIVTRIRQVLDVEVCSVYLTDNVSHEHVLVGTDGLDPAAVGRVRLGPHEGLVGLVAERSEPVNVRDAPHHPRFKAVPLCGEEPYHAFLGVPLIHQSILLGVLVVQKVDAHRFREADLAFLATLAAQLAGAVALAKIRGTLQELTPAAAEDRYFSATPGAPGVAIGTGVSVYSATALETVPDRVPTDVASEEHAFLSAIAHLKEDLKRVGSQLGQGLGEEERLLFDVYVMLAGSSSLIDGTVARIRAGNWAPGALRETIMEHIRPFETIEDPYLRERQYDILDIGRRILEQLQKESRAPRQYPEDTILIGEDLSPIDLADLPPGRLTGVLSGHGSAFSHLAILAHAMGIPAVLGLAGRIPLKQLDGRQIIVDGYRGRVYVDPGEAVRREFERLMQEERTLAQSLNTLRDEPAVTPDGIRIPLYTNVGLVRDLTHSLHVGSEGIGLYRTELPFLVRDRFPTEEEQRAIYHDVLRALAPRPVVVRTLDIGGDKALSYFPIKEANPFLGWRGIRIVLDHPELFLTQLRAILRAGEGIDNLSLLLPMISGVDELETALAFVRQAHREVNEEGVAVGMPQVGVMIEVPSAVYQADAMAQRADFLSIGTNDLTQYLLAVDRNNEQVARLYDPMHPAVIHAILEVVEAGHRHRRPVSVCGEAAGDPGFSLLLLGMEIDSLSLSAGDLPGIKWMIRNITRQRAREVLMTVLSYERPAQIRELLTAQLIEAGLDSLIRPGQ